MTYDKTIIAQNIRQARQAKGYSQDYLSYRLRMSQNSYSKVEQAITKLTLERLLAIADVLETDPVELVRNKAA